MAVAAVELDAAAVRSEKILLQMDGVIEFDRARVFEICAQRGEFGVARKRKHGAGETRHPSARREIRVTLCAGIVTHGDKLRAAEMFDMARTTRGCENLRGLVDGSVVTGEARLIGYRMAKGNCIGSVASGAVLREECMGLGNRAHAVCRPTAGNARDGEPQKRKNG